MTAEEKALDSDQDIANSSTSYSLNDIWELESKLSVPDFTYNNMGSENPGQKVEIENPPPLLLRIQSKFGQYSIDKDQSVDDKNLERKLERRDSGSKQYIGHSTIFLPQSAASFYDKNLLQTDVSVLEMCESIDKLNQYLKTKKAYLKAGIPGSFLHAVMGQEVAGNVHMVV